MYKNTEQNTKQDKNTSILHK